MYSYNLGPFGFLGTFLFWVVAILIIAAIIRLATGGSRRARWHDYHHSQTMHGDHNMSAMETLKRRYAKGEITKEQFDSMKKDIGEQQ